MRKAVYHVPLANLSRLEEKLVKLNKRASKLGVRPLFYDASKHYTVTRKVKGVDKVEDVVHFVLESRTVKTGDWTFVATLEHAGEAGNIIRSVPGAPELPTVYRDSPSTVCDHCKAKRHRKATYVLTDGAGLWIQVGSTCIGDFLGRDGDNAARRAEWLADVSVAISDEEDWGGGSRGEFRYESRVFLAFTARDIRDNGWLSRSAVRGSSTWATADNATELYRDWDSRSKEHMVPDPTDAELAEADEALAWAREISPDTDSDYLHNLRVVTSTATVNFRGLGLLASALPTYRREMERELKRREFAKRAADSEFLGTVGKRLTFRGKVVMVKEFGGDYGTSFLTKLMVDGKDTVTWFSSREMYRGETYDVTATVKEHRTYNGSKETVVTRGRFEMVEVEEEAVSA